MHSIISCPELELINNHLFQPCRFYISNVETDPESIEYSGYNFTLNDQNIKFRVAKITPTKTGQFVTIWKRNEKGVAEPFHITDNFSSLIVATRTDKNFGLFIFPKEVLREQKILSDDNSAGKRGIRVYPPWDITTNKQAQKAQRWQTEYFIDLSGNDSTDFEKVAELLG
ncbi:MepB family protein [Taibaiella soli]|uniref:MepB family protein n=2 Tax=Taibaiella soli TaxID=1649169 RepID=A0A2W2C2K9_9BACT|nr:MepB family protein [Taibaiella soli]